MNRERARELLPIIQAFAEGKAVQFKDSTGVWHTIYEPSARMEFNDYSEYRIKPEPMECWVGVYTDGRADPFLSAYPTKEFAEYSTSYIDCDEVKHFREVIDE